MLSFSFASSCSLCPLSLVRGFCAQFLLLQSNMAASNGIGLTVLSEKNVAPKKVVKQIRNFVQEEHSARASQRKQNTQVPAQERDAAVLYRLNLLARSLESVSSAASSNSASAAIMDDE